MRIFTLLLITIAASAFAKEKVFGNGSLPAFLRHFDTNSDGLIDEEERQAERVCRAPHHKNVVAPATSAVRPGAGIGQSPGKC